MTTYQTSFFHSLLHVENGITINLSAQARNLGAILDSLFTFPSNPLAIPIDSTIEIHYISRLSKFFHLHCHLEGTINHSLLP